MNRLNGDFRAIARIFRELRADIEAINTRLSELESSAVYRKKTAPFEQRRFIHEAIDEVFNRPELSEFIFKISELERLKSHGRNDDVMSLSYDGLSGEGKLDTALQLVLFMRRHNRYSQLIKILKAERDQVNWSEFK